MSGDSGITRRGNWSRTKASYSRSKGEWLIGWWTVKGEEVRGYIIVFKGYPKMYYIRADGGPIHFDNPHNIGPFKTLAAAKMMYIFMFGGSL